MANETMGFWITDENGRFLEVNDAYARRSGYTRPALLSMHITDVEAREAAAETAAHHESVRRQGTDLFETQHRTRAGEIWPVGINTMYADGRFFSFLHDISPHWQAEKALRDSEGRYQQLYNTMLLGVVYQAA
ncbi:MAG: PAS domain S-box protein, partial [Anaerolineales bacterium]|nr:PAS domain S-box protein [Anaerolineales bacterium]